MAKITIVLEDKPDGLHIACYGAKPSEDKEKWTMAQRVAEIIGQSVAEYTVKAAEKNAVH